jgi:hypothetical protein
MIKSSNLVTDTNTTKVLIKLVSHMNQTILKVAVSSFKLDLIEARIPAAFCNQVQGYVRAYLVEVMLATKGSCNEHSQNLNHVLGKLYTANSMHKY